jgi:hypothetical protein
MNLHQIRLDLSAALSDLGWNSYAYLPDDISVFPAAAVRVPTAITYNSAGGGVSTITLPVTLLVSRANAQDAQQRLDLALSTGNPESVTDALRAVTEPSWRALQPTGVSNFGSTQLGNTSVLAADLNLELMA